MSLLNRPTETPFLFMRTMSSLNCFLYPKNVLFAIAYRINTLLFGS